MKRAHKLIVAIVLFGAISACLWCLLCPILFPQRVKAANDSYQKWLAQHPDSKQ